MVVGAKDVVESRPVKLGALQGEAWVIQSGLAPGERVIVDGIQKAAAGSRSSRSRRSDVRASSSIAPSSRG